MYITQLVSLIVLSLKEATKIRRMIN